MFIWKELLEHLQSELADNSPETETDLLRWANASLRKITDRQNWEALREIRTLTPSSGVVYLPAAYGTGLHIYDSNMDINFKKVHPNREHRAVSYFYQPTGMRGSNGVEYATIACVQDSQTVTISGTPDLSSLVTEEAFAFTGVSGLFEITAVDDDADTLTLWPAFPEDDGNYAGAYQPAEQRKLTLYDPDGTTYSGDVKIEFFKRHPKLIGENSVVLVDFYWSLYFDILKSAMRNQRYVTDVDRLNFEAKEAWTNDVESEGGPEAPLTPRGKPGYKATYALTSQRGHRNPAAERRY